MRLLLIVLMMLLLPVRGGLGDAMALQMQWPTAVAIKIIATTPVTTGLKATFGLNQASLHAGCDTHDQAPSGGADHAKLCNLCDICHGVAVTLPSDAVHPRFARPARLRPAEASPFASATPAPGLKPPIS